MRLAQQGAIDAEWPRRGIAHFVGHGVVSEAKPWEARLQVLVAPPQSVGGLPAFSGWQVLRRKFARAGHSRHPESANWMVEIDRRSVADVLNHLSRPVVWLGGCSVGCQGPDASGGATGLVQAFLDNGTKYVIAPIREVHDLSAAMLACVFYGCAREESTAGQPPDVMLRRAKRLLRLGWAEQPSAANWVVECFSQPTPADMAELIVAPMDLAFDLALSAQTGHCLNVRNELGRREEWHFDRIGEFLIEPLCTDQSDECVRIQWNALKSEAVKSIHAFRTAWKKFVSEFVANRADPRSGWPNPAFADSLNAFCCFQGDPS